MGKQVEQMLPERSIRFFYILFYSISALQCLALKVYSNMYCSPNLKYVQIIIKSKLLVGINNEHPLTESYTLDIQPNLVYLT